MDIKSRDFQHGGVQVAKCRELVNKLNISMIEVGNGRKKKRMTAWDSLSP